MKPRVPKVSKQGVDRAVHQMSHQSSSEEGPALPKKGPLSPKANSSALVVAGSRFRDVLTHAEIVGVWAFAWLPETSGNVTHPGFKVDGKPMDPLDLLDPHNLHLGAFVDGFVRQPEAVLDLLTRFRKYIRQEVGKPGKSLAHAVLYEAETPKEAASLLAKAEGNKTAVSVDSAAKRLRHHRAIRKDSTENPLWPSVATTGANPVPKKARAARGQKR